MDMGIDKICESTEVGIINEIGDLGLGFDPISEEDSEKIQESLK